MAQSPTSSVTGNQINRQQQQQQQQKELWALVQTVDIELNEVVSFYISNEMEKREREIFYLG